MADLRELTEAQAAAGLTPEHVDLVRMLVQARSPILSNVPPEVQQAATGTQPTGMGTLEALAHFLGQTLMMRGGISAPTRTLFRAGHPEEGTLRKFGEWWTSSPENAASYLGYLGPERNALFRLTAPVADLEKYRMLREYRLPPELTQLGKPYLSRFAIKPHP